MPPPNFYCAEVLSIIDMIGEGTSHTRIPLLNDIGLGTISIKNDFMLYGIRRVVMMLDVLLEKINNIERMIMELNTKIDNFLGYEDLTADEKKRIRKICEEIKKGEYKNHRGGL